MAIYPGAVARIIPRHNQRRMAVYNRMNLHVAVSEARSLHGFFSNAAVCSHFYVAKDGTVEQYIDTAYRSKADLEGNDATISVETQGGVHDAQGEPWTDAQVVALAGLFAWAANEHGIPFKLATDSLPGESSRGLSWHRLGCDPWRKLGGIKYSNARGKICPGDAKIAQIPQVLALAVQPQVIEVSPPPATTEEVVFFATIDGVTYIGDGITRRKVSNNKEVAAIKWQFDQAGRKLHDAGPVEEIDWLGVEVK